MSIEESSKLDAVGEDRDENALRLMISDHLDWQDEGFHLGLLQDKINMYLQYIESKQYVKKYGNEFSKFYIDIYFQESITENCVHFLKVVSEQLNPESILLICTLSNTK